MSDELSKLLANVVTDPSLGPDEFRIGYPTKMEFVTRPGGEIILFDPVTVTPEGDFSHRVTFAPAVLGRLIRK